MRPPAGRQRGRGAKKKGGIPDTFGRCRYILAAQAGRAENAPGGKVFSGVQKQAAECGAEGAAGFQPPPPAASSPSAKKKKGKADTDTSAATDIFGCAPARKSEHNARWRRLHFPSFRTAAAGQIADSANCWRNNPAEFFQKIFCGNFARAFFSKCFGPASPPCQTSPLSPPPNSGGEFAREFFARPQRRVPSAAASSARHIPARPGRRHAHGIALRPSPDIRRALPLSPAAWRRRGRTASDGRDATFPAGCALLRRQRCTCAGNAARGMRDRSPGRAAADKSGSPPPSGSGAVHSPSAIGGARRRIIRQVHSRGGVHSPSVIGGARRGKGAATIRQMRGVFGG